MSRLTWNVTLQTRRIILRYYHHPASQDEHSWCLGTQWARSTYSNLRPLYTSSRKACQSRMMTLEIWPPFDVFSASIALFGGRALYHDWPHGGGTGRGTGCEVAYCKNAAFIISSFRHRNIWQLLSLEVWHCRPQRSWGNFNDLMRHNDKNRILDE